MPLVEELVSPPDAAIACERLQGLPYLLFLDSATRGTRLGRYSFVAADPAFVIRSKGHYTRIIDSRTGAERAVESDALTTIRSLVDPYRAEAVAGLPPFQGG